MDEKTVRETLDELKSRVQKLEKAVKDLKQDLEKTKGSISAPLY